MALFCSSLAHVLFTQFVWKPDLPLSPPSHSLVIMGLQRSRRARSSRFSLFSGAYSVGGAVPRTGPACSVRRRVIVHSFACPLAVKCNSVVSAAAAVVVWYGVRSPF